MKVNARTIPNGWKYTAYLNGERVPFCIEADDVEGYVIVQDHEPGDGPGVRFRDSQTRLEGKVTIEGPTE